MIVVIGIGVASFGAIKLMKADPLNPLIQPNWEFWGGSTGPDLLTGGQLITNREFATPDDPSFVFAQIGSHLDGWSKHIVDDGEYYGYYSMHRRSGEYKILVRHILDKTEIEIVRPANAYERLEMRLPI